MRIFWAIIVALIIVFISGLLFNILKIAMGSGSSFIGVIIQLTPFMIGIWLIKYSWTKITYTEEPKENIIDNTQSLAKAVINHSKELVQEVKPTINNYIQKHNKIDEIVIKDNLKVEDINEDEIYEQVLHEIEKDDKVKSTWAKALSQSDGDDKKAQSLYIKLRVDFLIEEKKKIIENEKREYEELEKKRVEYERLEQEKVENERRFKEKVENEKRERERLERHKLEDKKMAKIMAKAFIGIIIAFIIYFSYDQLTDIFSIEKQVGNGDKYYLQLDIRKYYYNINHNILRNFISKKIKDERIVNLIMLFVDTVKGIGLFVGNVLSQLFGLIYLSPLDHFVKRVLKIKHYIRYVDDFVLVGLEKSEAHILKSKIESFLKDNLNLELSKFRIAKIKQGCNFVGFRTWKRVKFIRKHTLHNFSKAVKLQKEASIISILGHAKHSSSHKYLISKLGA